MRKKLFAISTLHLFLIHAPPGHALQHSSVCSRQGPVTECGEGTLENLHVAGKATLNGTIVLKETTIAGMLKADNVRLNTLHAAGMVKLKRATLNRLSKISGLLTACDSQLDTLTLSSDRAYLSSVLSKDIRIEPGGKFQVLCVANNSLVKGDISFSSGNGLVAMDNTSKISGQVIGGKINYELFKYYCEGVQTC